MSDGSQVVAARDGVASGPKLEFPMPSAAGPQVNAADCKAPGTGLHVVVAGVIAFFSIAAIALSTMGIGLLGLIVLPIIDFFLRKRVMAAIRASHLEVGPNQLPQLYACVKDYAHRLGMKEVPHVFIVESHALNAAAMRLGARHIVHLNDDIVWGALKAGDPQALSFVVAHELAHHALGHSGGFRSYLRTVWRKLSRLDELSCDAVALQLVGTHEAAYSGLMMLMVGPQLMPFVDREQLLGQAASASADKATEKAARTSTHPFLAQRIQHLRLARLS